MKPSDNQKPGRTERLENEVISELGIVLKPGEDSNGPHRSDAGLN